MIGKGWSAMAALLVVALTLAMAIAGPARIAASPETTLTSEAAVETTATAEDAVRVAVEAAGDRYAGDCAAAISPRDAGKVCSRFVEARATLHAYLTGRTFSEFSTWVFVESTASGWRPVGIAPLDFFATELTIPWPSR